MDETNKSDFCTVCRKNTTYTMRKEYIERFVKGRKYSYCITVALCNKCGKKMSLPGLIDKNVQEVEEQYHAYEQHTLNS